MTSGPGGRARVIAVLGTVLSGVALSVAGCTSAGPAPGGADAAASSDGPAPGPPLAGTLLVAGYDDNENGDLYRVTQDAQGEFTGTSLLSTTTTSIISDAALSPNGQTLAYATDDGVVLHTMATGEEVTVMSPSGYPETATAQCLEWAPDSQHLATHGTEGAVVTGLDGNAVPVAEAPSALYTAQGTMVTAGNSDTHPITSTLSCPRWADNTHLVFDRRIAPMPSQLADDHAEVPADTTTVATIGPATPALANSRFRWTLVASCGNYLLTEVGGRYYVLRQPTERQLTDQNVVAPRTGQLTVAGLTAQDTFEFFRPGSCQLVVGTWGAEHTDQLTVTTIDPATAKPVNAHTVTVDGDENGPDPTCTLVPSPDPSSPVLAYVDGSDGGDNEARLIDLNTGGITDIKGPWSQASAMAAWSH